MHRYVDISCNFVEISRLEPEVNNPSSSVGNFYTPLYARSRIIKKLFFGTRGIENVERRFFVEAFILKEKHFEEIA